MKREIKFRGKRVDNGAWIYGSYHPHEDKMLGIVSEKDVLENKKSLIIIDGMSDWNLSKPINYYEVIPESVGEYTGLKDSKNVEIYEGDFLKLSDEYRGKGEIPSYVIWENSQWMMQGIMHYSHKDFIMNYSLDNMNVIGNIYDNPELL